MYPLYLPALPGPLKATPAFPGFSRWGMARHGRWPMGVHLAIAQLYSELLGSGMRRRGWVYTFWDDHWGWGLKQLGDIFWHYFWFQDWICALFCIYIYIYIYIYIHKGPCHKTGRCVFDELCGGTCRNWVRQVNTFLYHVQHLEKLRATKSVSHFKHMMHRVIDL